MGTRLGVKSEHVCEDKGIRIWCRVENEAGIGQWRMEARAVGDEIGGPVIVVVEVLANGLCMELF